MPPADGRDDTARLVDEVAGRAVDAADEESTPLRPDLSSAQLSPHAQMALADARHHIRAASETSSVGTAIPAEARLRQAKQAVIATMRPVTSHQVPFNAEILLVVERLTSVVEEVASRLHLVDTLEERADDTLRRVRAGIATVEVQVDDLQHDQEIARTAREATREALEALTAQVADLARTVATSRAREEVVLRAARDAAAPASATEIADVADEVAIADRALLRRLADVGRPGADVVAGWARTLLEVVAVAPGPVLDLNPDRGEWLDVWAGLDVPSRGVEADASRAAALRGRGHDVVDGEPAAHLAATTPGSLGAVTAAVLADVTPLADLVAVIDAAAVALRPGGALVLAAAHPVGAPPGDALWADPRRRPRHPETLWALAVDRGFAEVEVLALEPTADPGGTPAGGTPAGGTPAGGRGAQTTPASGRGAQTTRVYALVARTVGGAPRTP